MVRFPLRALVTAAVLLHGTSAGQDALPPLPPREKAPAALRFLSPILIPKVLQDCWRLKAYVRSEELARARAVHGDLYAVDCVFDMALRLCWDNEYEALLVSAFALMDHERVGLRIPLLGAVLWFPLTSEFGSDFRARVDALPSRLYTDTPPGKEGDRDKLQHFFGAAFLTALSGSAEAADRIGLFVEWGEEHFIEGGVNDERDVRADRQGERFALALLADPAARPSLFLTVEAGGSPVPGGPAGAAAADTLHEQQEAP